MKNPVFQLMPFLTKAGLFTKKWHMKTPYGRSIGSLIDGTICKNFIPYSPLGFEQSIMIHDSPKAQLAPIYMTTRVTDKNKAMTSLAGKARLNSKNRGLRP